MQQLKNIYHLIEAILANIIFGFPSRKLKIIAITGTDGKTTTSTLLYHILQSAGKKVALISTVAAYIGDEEIDTGFHVTTPSSFALQKLLFRIVRENMEYVVMEVTSHGIDQNRVWGITPSIAGITNVTHEHLDYHKTYDRYLTTKAQLLLRAQSSFLNMDAIESFEKLKTILESAHHAYETYNTHTLHKNIAAAVRKRFGTQQYNFENAALASAVARKLDISEKTVANAIIQFRGVPGRMQSIPNRLGFHIIVDFAHTPHALEEALQALTNKKSHKNGKVIVIFGCAGLRDHTKRPLMGDIATRLADYVILTAEDPRTEPVESIIYQIKSGIKTGHNKVISFPDRFAAIHYALTQLAKKGDTVIVTGKGHEKSMCFGTTEYPWNDADAIENILQTL